MMLRMLAWDCCKSERDGFHCRAGDALHWSWRRTRSRALPSGDCPYCVEHVAGSAEWHKGKVPTPRRVSLHRPGAG
ncbi:uncharacterized protein EI90DRAFT_3047008 [Cantharellus anzutake]|uniref:uncharacterized protein n=1 Tax=Cantharellus anzutake TaxID=1750568 RepID=UPI00190668E2|nr:uncharacterized protein EI90DRAFT_3047008 [Cantharellus anzutake]KAF8335744.1 hypothetical protein EI90DRAFT_3047008 [Cantharellus anzutake]